MSPNTGRQLTLASPVYFHGCALGLQSLAEVASTPATSDTPLLPCWSMSCLLSRDFRVRNNDNTPRLYSLSDMFKAQH